MLRTPRRTVGSVLAGLVLGSAVLTLACDDDLNRVRVTSNTMRVRLGTPSLIVGTTTRSSAFLVDPAGVETATEQVTWASSNTGIGTISTTGLVTGVAPGTTEISATESLGGAGAVGSSLAAEPAMGSVSLPVTSPMQFDVFTQYANTEALLANVGPDQLYCEAIAPQRIAIDPGVTYNGHRTVRVDQPAGSSGIARLTTCFTSQHFWFRIKLRFSPGWTTAGSIGSSANSFKMFGWGWREGDGRGDLEITNTTQYQLHFDPQFAGAPFISVNAGSVTTEWTDGAWYDYIIHYQVTNGGSTTRFWFARDGEPPVLRATANGTVAATASSIGFPFFFNQTLRASQSLWIGQWEVVDGTQFPNPFGL